jgi:hypothetical protein
MRTSVGPLPAAVYWRRRAVVLGAVVVGILVLFLSCGGNGDKADPKGTGATTPLPSTSTTPEIEPSFEDALPGGPVLPDPSEVVVPTTAPPVVAPSAGSSTGPNVNVAAPEGQCLDAEMSVTPVPARATAKRGTAVAVRLKIRNIATRSCTRDLGADVQEIYIKQGARVIWSSDKCSPVGQPNVQTLRQGQELEFGVTWNGHMSSKCTGGLATGPFPLLGEYQIFGRLGEKVSNPVTVVITA